jgi:hypothetical protein
VIRAPTGGNKIAQGNAGNALGTGTQTKPSPERA